MRSGEPCAVCECSRSTAQPKPGGGPERRLAELSCVYAECPEDLGVAAQWESEEPGHAEKPLVAHKETASGRQKRASDPGVDRQCYFAYQLDQCCGQSTCQTNQTAAAPTAAVAATAATVLPTSCSFEGRRYLPGQRIYSDEQHLSCNYCICQAGFDPASFGTGPACTRIDCNSVEMEQRLRAGCTPIYHQRGCCPIDYHCRESADRVLTAVSLGKMLTSISFVIRLSS